MPSGFDLYYILNTVAVAEMRWLALTATPL